MDGTTVHLQDGTPGTIHRIPIPLADGLNGHADFVLYKQHDTWRGEQLQPHVLAQLLAAERLVNGNSAQTPEPNRILKPPTDIVVPRLAKAIR